MKLLHSTVAAFVLTLAAASASADSAQLAASAGLDPNDAAGMTLVEIARVKFNADTRADDRQPVSVPVADAGERARSQLIAAAGMTSAEAADMTVAELAAAKNVREARGDERRTVVASTGAIDGGAARAQILASIGLDPEVGRAMSFNEIYLAKTIRESSDR